MTRTTFSDWMGAATMAAALALGSQQADAAPVNYQGSFTQDDQHVVLDIHLDALSTLSAKTLSWAQGGFAPVLSLFGAGGLLQQAVGSSNSCGAGSGAADPATGFCWDAMLGGQFAAGDYTLVLTQDGNLPIGGAPADGFQQDGQPGYTGAWYLGDASRSFINVDGSQRSGFWALQFESQAVDLHNVPEPAGWALSGLALLAALAASRRRNRQPAGRA